MAEEKSVVAPTPVADLHAAALKAFEQGPEVKEAPKVEDQAGEKVALEPEEKKPEVDPDEEAALKKPEEKKPEDKKDEAPKGWERPFEKLAAERAALRAEKQALTANKAVLEEAAALRAAKASGDPLALLKAAGFEWNDALNAALGAKKAGKKPATPEGDEVSQLRQEIQAMKEERQTQDIIGQVSSVVGAGGDKFKLVKELSSPKDIFDQLDAYYRTHGELPEPGDMKTSIEMMAEVMEQDHKARAQKYAKAMGLTQPADSVKVVPKSAVDVAPSALAKTLTNAHDSAPRATTTTQASPTTDIEELRRRALEVLEKGR